MVDTLCTVAVCSNTFLYMIIFPLAGKFPDVQIWPLPVTIFATGCSAFFEQSFLIHRFWRLSRNKPITFILSFLTLTQLIFAFISGTYVAIVPVFAPNFGTKATTVSVSLRSATDLLIAIALVIKLHSFETSFVSTRQLIRRVSFISLTAGLMCAVTSTLMLALYEKQALVFDLFLACLGRVYSLTILINFFTIRPRSHSSTNANVHGPSDMINPLTRLPSIRFDDLTSPGDVGRSMVLTEISSGGTPSNVTSSADSEDMNHGPASEKF